MQVKYCAGSACAKIVSSFVAVIIQSLPHSARARNGGEVAEARGSFLCALFLRGCAWLMTYFDDHLLVAADVAAFSRSGTSKAFASKGIFRFSVIPWPLAKCVGSCQ